MSSDPNKWMPIETAPEDEHILLATSGGHVGTAYWTDEGDGKVWAWGHPERDGGQYIHPNLTPQAWMPLPKHPGDMPETVFEKSARWAWPDGRPEL
jgi:hypothetical protein